MSPAQRRQAEATLARRLKNLGPTLSDYQEYLYRNGETYEWHSADPDLSSQPVALTSEEIEALDILKWLGHTTEETTRSGAIRVLLLTDAMAD